MRRRPARAAALAALSFVAVAYLWPLGAIVVRSLAGGNGTGRLSWSVITATLGDARIGRLARFTLIETVLSVLGAVVVGAPLGWVMGRFEFRGRRLMLTLCIVPFVLPTVVLGAAVASLAPASALGSRGGLNLLLIVVAHVVFNLGIVVRTVAAFVGSIDPRIEDAARSLGRSRVGALRSVLAPLSAPVIASAALIVALFSLTSFGVIVALGGASHGTVEVEIWYQTTQLLHLPVAAVLAICQLVVVAAMVVTYQRLGRRRVVGSGGAGGAVHTRRRPVSAERWAVAGSVAVVLAVVAVPLGALAVRSLRLHGAWTLDHYRHLGSSLSETTLGVAPLSALSHSLSTAALAAALALVVALPAAVAVTAGGRLGRWVDRAVMMPLGTSAATIGFGFLVAFSGPLLDLRGTWVIVPLIQATVAAPIVIRALVPALRGVPPLLIDAAATCGAGRLRRGIEVVVPLVRRPLFMASGLAVAVSLGEFGATSFVSRTDAPTVPIAIGRLLGRPGAANIGQAMALSCILAALCAGVFAVVDLLAEGRTGEF